MDRLQRNQQRSWHWRECQDDLTAAWMYDKPREPAMGQGWFDPRTNCLHIWNGWEWVCVPAD